jgi:carboxylesterase
MARPFIRQVVKKSIDTLHPEWQGYPVNPIIPILQMHKLQLEVWPLLAQLRQPLLIVQGRHDADIDLDGVARMYHLVGGSPKEFHWMENSGHVVMLEQEREQVAEVTARFIYRVLSRKKMKGRADV